MYHFWKKVTTVSVFTLALVVGGCESAGEPAAQRLMGPDMDAPAYSRGRTVQSASYRKLKGDDGAGQSISATIGTRGGSLTLGQHTIIVPRDAVAQNTVFTMTLKDADAMTVDLTAVAYNNRGEVIFTGEQGFRAPVRLGLNFSRATESFSASDLVIVWWKADGSYEVRPTTVNASGQVAVTDLWHFSDYALAVPF